MKLEIEDLDEKIDQVLDNQTAIMDKLGITLDEDQDEDLDEELDEYQEEKPKPKKEKVKNKEEERVDITDEF